jgi:hypothetical protein
MKGRPRGRFDGLENVDWSGHPWRWISIGLGGHCHGLSMALDWLQVRFDQLES